MKWLAAQIAGGAVLGFVGSSLLGPTIISWWYKPPSGDAFSCAGSVQSALSQFVTMQLVSAAIGGLALAGIVFFVRRAFKGRGNSQESAA